MLAIIPARLGSERLRRKPLQVLAGQPLIHWVWQKATSFRCLSAAVIATDAEEIADAVHAFGGSAVLTSTAHKSGTERCAEVAARAEFSAYDVVVNIQGDEPFILEDHVAGALQRVRQGFDVGTVAAPVRTLDAWHDPSVVKVVCGGQGRALYFSRSPVPYMRERQPSAEELASEAFLRHIGVYAYSPAALQKWVALPETLLEQVEKLEQLRPLAAGMSIGVGVVSEPAFGIDTAEDLARAEALLNGQHRRQQNG